ncbi:hypothetical protein [Actinophytocola algeriensis]|jgi:hypothetical protein|uniref:Uncharacterized protein n=1 Tax=Actinophytocola algeriensis TaxID=1768010 RepID=A0A7W7Q8J1_9PSEU|nr:hypothetical protein [Actinophytocola algeriensis]MBB4908614.1 hypothetical protein [Actinophytocola algeriensis]MBE1474999.1 hypothetical protein [Actinophytocola algeriensis]
MRWLRAGAVLGVAVAASGAVLRRHTDEDDTSRWLVVTVNAEPDAVAGDPRFTEAFAAFGDDVETRVAAAPGERGTEVAARVRQAPARATARMAGHDPRQDVRRTLRDVKSLLETGDVLRTDPPTTGKPTPGGALVRLFTRRAGGEGRL